MWDAPRRHGRACVLLIAILVLPPSVCVLAQDDFVAEARAAKAKGDVDAAIQLLVGGLGGDPDNAEAHYVLGWLYAGRGEGPTGVSPWGARNREKGTSEVCSLLLARSHHGTISPGPHLRVWTPSGSKRVHPGGARHLRPPRAATRRREPASTCGASRRERL